MIKKLRGNVHLEEFKVKEEERIGKGVYISKVNVKIQVDRGRKVWEQLARPSLEHAAEVGFTGTNCT